MKLNFKSTPEYRDAKAEVEKMIAAAVRPLKKQISDLENEVGAQADRIKALEAQGEKDPSGFA